MLRLMSKSLMGWTTFPESHSFKRLKNGVEINIYVSLIFLRNQVQYILKIQINQKYYRKNHFMQKEIQRRWKQ